MLRKIPTALAFLATVIAILIGIWFGANLYHKNFLIHQGNEIVKRVELFRQDRGRLPENLREIGLPESEEGPLYYEKRGDLNYAIFFSRGFDDSWGYYSDTKQWEFGYRKIDF